RRVPSSAVAHLVLVRPNALHPRHPRSRQCLAGVLCSTPIFLVWLLPRGGYRASRLPTSVRCRFAHPLHRVRRLDAPIPYSSPATLRRRGLPYLGCSGGFGCGLVCRRARFRQRSAPCISAVFHAGDSCLSHRFGLLGYF